MGIRSLNLNNTNLDDANFDEDDLETIIHVKLTVWHNRFMWDRCLSENKKKSTEQTESLNLSDKPQLESDEEKVKEEKRLKNY